MKRKQSSKAIVQQAVAQSYYRFAEGIKQQIRISEIPFLD